ncbi:MAG: YggS family pyridoxal phosphate-dependent enzyme [Gammaproteobacteria bacterium]|nr:YggS family pyridoxal phosphate-dependent enzyme [Gammaproteobacteria bacterium]
MRSIANNLKDVRARIQKATRAAGRPDDSVHLIAVSKTRPAEDLREAFAAGQRRFGENYVQEALDKQHQLADLALEWHFIGPLQSNKSRAIAEHFDWLHSLDRLKLAERLNAQRPAQRPPLQVCIQVNLDDETSKSGVTLDQVEALADAIIPLPRLTLRGLMASPRPDQDEPALRERFAALANTLRHLQDRYPALPLDTLSIGMSDDLEAAIAEGATQVRIGTAIFGERSPKTTPDA